MDQIECAPATILVVEDEEILCQLTKRVLAWKGFDVLVADSAEEALKIIQSHEGAIDLLLTDMCMPGMNGVDLGAVFIRMHPQSKVIYMTASAPQDISARLDSELIIHKPFCLFELCDTLNKILGGKSSSNARQA